MFDTWFYYIPLTVFSGLFLLSIRIYRRGEDYRGKNSLPLIVIGLYFLSSFLVIFVDVDGWYPYLHNLSLNASSFLLYSMLLAACLLPALFMKPTLDRRFLKLVIPDHLIYAVVIGGIFSVLYLAPHAVSTMSSDLRDLRLQRLLDNEISALPRTFLTTLALGISYFYAFYIALFFLALVQKRSKLIIFGLLLASLSFVVSGLVFATRDVFVFYALSFVSTFVYFQELIPKRIKSVFGKWVILLVIPMFLGVVFVSMQRFGDADQLLRGTVGYLGQQPFIFAETLYMQSEFYNGSLRFPIVTKLLGQHVEIIRTSNYERSFGTFIKDMYSEGGYFFMLSFTALFSVFFATKLRQFRRMRPVQSLILNIFYIQFMSMGIFYFKMGSQAGNIYMLVLFFVYLYFGLNRRSSAR